VGVLELVLHVAQTRAPVPASDWESARSYVAAEARPDDLVAFAPRWVDPVGRQHFGSALADLEREARPDESRFPRALEVAIRGAHLPELRGWRALAERRFGGVTVTTLENPAPAHVIEDLVGAFGPDRARVTQLQGSVEVPCAFGRGTPQTGGLGFGPAIPGERFVCPGGGFVGVSVVADLDYRPRRCLYAPPQGSGTLRVRFQDVQFGPSLHGHHGLYVEAERGRAGAPVTLSFTASGAPIGSVVHRDGEGWKPFEFETAELAGKRAELVAEVSSSGDRRLYCFEADTRER